MYTQLPESPVRKVYKCRHCGDVSIKFYDPKQDRVYTAAEWEVIITDGRQALDKALRLVREDPKFFS
jgi:hypothetical protein|tara:strand:- start:1061 stop:1261 length:201 start_codon:yes stop_codon:yes gene_type:complete